MTESSSQVGCQWPVSLPVRHPGRLGRERVGQPRQDQPSRAVLGDRGPVSDAGPDDRPTPGVRTAPAGAAVISHRATARWRCRSPVRRRTQCLVLADQAGNVQRRLNVRVTPTVGIPPTPRFRPSSSAVARLCRNQCGIDPGGLIPFFRNADALSRALAQGGQQRGPRQIHRRIDELAARTKDLEILRITLVLGQLGCPRGVAYIRLRPAARQRMRTVFGAATMFGGPILLVRPVLPRTVPAAPRICRSVRIAVRS